jgi:hypothetical protein
VQVECIYYVYGPVIRAWINDIQSGNITGYFSKHPVLGSKNPLDEALRKYSNPFQSRADFVYHSLAAEEERLEPWALLR